MIIAQIVNEISSAPRMLYFVTFRGRRVPTSIFPKKKFLSSIFHFLCLWARLYNLMKQNNNLSIFKKIENPLLNPRKTFRRVFGTDNVKIGHTLKNVFQTRD